MHRDDLFFQRVVEKGSAGLTVLDSQGGVTYANAAAIRLLADDPTGREFAALFSRDFRNRYAAYWTDLRLRTEPADSAFFSGDIVRGDGSKLRLEVKGANLLRVPEVRGVVLALADATDQHLREQALVQQMSTDSVTGLPNRLVYYDRLRAALGAHLDGSVAYIDVDKFKGINDRFGHATGDELLRAIGARLVAALPEAATVARIGGDEFGVLLPRIALPKAQELMTLAAAAVARPFELASQPIIATISIGIAGLDGSSPQALLQDCDMALYAAKMRGRNRAVVFDDDVRAIIDDRRELSVTVMQLRNDNQQLSAEARTDALTGLRNRRALLEIEDQVLGTLGCAWTVVAAIFIDIDHFGSYNKAHTDAGGDEALRCVAAALQGTARETDLVFRKGGEELVLLLPEVDLHAATAAGERIRSAVEALAIPHRGSAVSTVLTVTVGVATGRHGESIQQIIAAAADVAMQGKTRQQRNCVHAAVTPSPPAPPAPPPAPARSTRPSVR